MLAPVTCLPLATATALAAATFTLTACSDEPSPVEVARPKLSVRAQAAFRVNSTADAVDAAPGNGVCRTARGVCTLRAAQNNGGSTATHALLAGSPALNAANLARPGSGYPACPPRDQRLELRGATRCDIGAFEVQ